MRVRLNVKKMTDADALKVSLVRRAASRIPFRIVKSNKSVEEDGMINLARIFKADSAKQETVAAAQKPGVIAFVVKKSAASDELRDKLAETGFEIGETVENDDDTVSYIAKGEKLDENDAVIRQSDELLVVTKSFGDAVSGYRITNGDWGFYSNLATAASYLVDKVNAAVSEAANTADAETAASAVIDNFKAYAMGLVSLTGSMVFKAEKLVAEHVAEQVKKASEEKVAQKSETGESAHEDGKASDKGDNVDAETGKQEQVVKADEAPAKKDPPAEPTLLDQFKEVLKAELEGVNTTIKTLQDSVGEVREAQTTLQTSVKEVVGKTESLEKQFSTTVIGAPNTEVTPSAKGTVKKAEVEMVIDTAFMSRGAKYR